MYFTHKEACAWAATHFENISQILLQKKNISFIICPSFDALFSIATFAQQYNLQLGAQDCSAYAKGAYTGQVTAASLLQLGCSYCIVGHSETRKYNNASNTDIAQKVEQLLNQNIIPIICVGETKKEYDQKNTLNVLRKQIDPILPLLRKNQKITYIAYEPIWSIGTDIVPSNDHLQLVYDNLSKLCKISSRADSVRFIYGGSVDKDTIQQINKISLIQGVLVGRASTDFQKIKTIVSLI